MTNQAHEFIMDTGPFLDVIPFILNYLDLKSLIQLSRTCHFWRERIYNDKKRWSKTIELPFIGAMESGNSKHSDLESAIKVKLWLMILPPEDPKALESILNNITSSKESIQRFAFVTKVDFKNYLHTDESLRLTALLFPLIEQIRFEGKLLTEIGIEYIAKGCKNLKYMEFYQCHRSLKADFLQLFNTEDHQRNLKRIFIHFETSFLSRDHFSIENYLPFMALCTKCRLFFNKIENEKEQLCLYHPGKYDGYGHSCSSFNCCGSNTPNYPSTLGCQYGYHTTTYDSEFNSFSKIYELHNGHPEYMFQPYNINMFFFHFSRRRSLKFCYKEINI
ncbi:hypothetical protein I4U23_006078 [Adineta vaga]|nr:hypothetical protein I4U23_006078 [Adineta vaga]